MSEQKVQAVNDLLCDAFIRGLNDPEVSPALLKAVIEYLKFMDFKALPVPGSKLREVAEQPALPMPFKPSGSEVAFRSPLSRSKA